MKARGGLAGIDINTLLILAAVGIGGYLLVKALGGLKKVADAGTSAAADVYLRMFPNPPAMVPQGAVVLPNGTAVPLDTLSATGTVQPTTQADGTPGATFVWQGARYYLNAPSDANGNWQASSTMGAAVDFGVTASGATGGW